MTEQIASEGGHWYHPDGVPCTEVPLKKPAKDGRTTTSPTIKHARLLGLLPSVTTVYKIKSEPGLTRWLIGRALKYGFDNRNLETVDALLEAYEKEASKPSDRGTLLHAGMERLLTGRFLDVEDMAAIKAHTIFSDWLLEYRAKRVGVESSFGNPALGFGGKVDFIGEREDKRFVVDFKFVQKERAPLDKECVQGAAYNVGLGNPDGEFHNFLFLESTGELVEHKTWTREELLWGWDVFSAAYELWVKYNDYDPREINVTK